MDASPIHPEVRQFLRKLNRRERSGVNGRVFDQHILDGLMEGILLAGFKRRRGWGGWSWFGLRETVLFSKASVT